MTASYSIVDREALADALATVARVAGKSGIMPIVTGVLIKADFNGLTIRCTNVDTQCTTRVNQIAFVTPFSLVVSAERLLDLCRKTSSDDVKIHEPDAPPKSQAKFEFGKLRVMIDVMDVADFPELAPEAETVSFWISRASLLAGFSRVAASISTEETRYYLNGIYLEVKGGDLCFTATDGYTLRQHRMPLPKDAYAMPGVIVPRLLVTEIIRLLQDADDLGLIKFTYSKMKDVLLVLDVGTITYVSKPIDGTYPDYPRVIPKNNDKLLVVTREELIEAVKAVAIISTAKRTCTLRFDMGVVTNISMSIDGELAAQEVAGKLCQGVTAVKMSIGFHHRQLLLMLSEMRSPAVTLKFGKPAIKDDKGNISSADPVEITGPSDTDMTYIIMPMRTV